MQNIGVLTSEENEFFIFNLFPLPTATVVVGHSPTPSAVRITAFSNGDG